MPAGVPVQQVLFTVFQSILQVFLLCFAGFALSFRGIVDKPTSKVLNHINVALFTPALLFSKVAFFLSPAKLRQLWIIPIFFTLVTSLSAVIAFGLARAFGLKRSQVNFATAASMFMNSNSLPVALMQSIATTVPNLKWGPDDTVDAMFGRSLTYLVVFSTLGMILRWSYGVRLLSSVNDPDPNIPTPSTYRDNDGTDNQNGLPHRPATRLVDYDTEANVDPHQKNPWRTRLPRSPLHPRLTPLSRRHTHSHSYLHTHLPAVPTSLGDQSESDDSDDLDTTEGESEETILLRSETIESGFSTEGPSVATAQPMPRWHQDDPPVSFWSRLYKMLTGLSPPLVASLLAIVVVLIPPLQRLLQSSAMIPFKGAMDVAGGCSVPLTLIVLGGWFWDGESKPKHKTDKAQAKCKGKEPHLRNNAVSTLIQNQSSASQHAAISKLQEPSRCSSSASLSSVLGAFGDVLLARIAVGGNVRSKWRSETSIVGEAEADVEQGRPTTHAEADYGRADNPERRPQSRKESVVNKDTHSRPLPTPDLVSPKFVEHPPGETLTVVVALLARMIIVPLVVTPLMVLASRLGWGGEVFEDPVFIVSSMLLVSSPPALTLAQISQHSKPTSAPSAKANADSADANAFSPFERLLSRTVFWAYLVLTPPVTIASVMVGLLLVGT